MVECSIRKVLPIVLILILLILMPVAALNFEESNSYLIPDLAGGSDISYLTPVGSSESSISSGSSTVIITPSSSQPQKSSVSPGLPLSFADKPPSHWIEGNRFGRFFDPLSRTSWQYDSILKKFYCPDKGWYLITRYSPDYPEDIIGQYYYDPVTVTLVDINTGLPIDPNTMEISSPLPSQSATITIIPTQIPETTRIPQNDPCQVSCPDCPAGFCRDCNKNQICDEIESGNPESATSDTSGQSEKPQDQVLPVPTIPTQKPTIIPANDGEQSENPQVFPVPTNTLAPGGGQSESAQAPVLAMQVGSKWSNENSDSTINNPKLPTQVLFENDVGVFSISTYHGNNGKGVSNVGSIGLKDSNGKIYGPWPASGKTGTGGEPNAIWIVFPTEEAADNSSLLLEKGTYTVLDSDESTWSNNAQSEFQGFCTISYMKVIKTATELSGDNISISELNLRNLSI